MSSSGQVLVVGGLWLCSARLGAECATQRFLTPPQGTPSHRQFLSDTHPPTHATRHPLLLSAVDLSSFLSSILHHAISLVGSSHLISTLMAPALPPLSCTVLSRLAAYPSACASFSRAFSSASAVAAAAARVAVSFVREQLGCATSSSTSTF